MSEVRFPDRGSFELNAFFLPVSGAGEFSNAAQAMAAQLLDGSWDNSRESERAKALIEEYTHARQLSEQHGWDDVGPKLFFDAGISIMPSTLRRYKPAERNLMPTTDPLNPLELYLLSRLPATALPTRDKEIEGGFTSIASIRVCLGDEVRSKLFLESVREGISSLEAQSDDPIEVMDAGCGALGVMGIYAALCSPRVHVTALELNPASAKMAQAVADSLGLSERVEVIAADATKYTPQRPIDLLVSETMNSALVSEPIVQIFSNLYPHVKPDGVCLPTGISVLASPVATTSFHDPHELVKSYGRPMEVVRTNWQQVADYTPGDRLEQIRAVFHADQLPRGGTMLALASEVRLLGGRVIGLYDSAITKPVYATKGILEGPWEVNSSKVEGVSVSYAPGQLISDAEVRIALKY